VPRLRHPRDPCLRPGLPRRAGPAPRAAIPQLSAPALLPRVVPLLRAASAETRGYAVAAVARFDQGEGEVQLVVEAGAVPLLLDLVRKGPDRCRLHALWMLSAIAGVQSP